MHALRRLDDWLGRRSTSQIVLVATCGVAVVWWADLITGHEVSSGLFYLVPVAVAAWYVGRWAGVLLALLSCVAWYVADTDHRYSHPAIPVWNALVRFGFFLICALLLTALRDGLLELRRLARRDALTKLFTRRAFEDRLDHDLTLAQRHHGAVTLAYVDLDDFKAINDTHGHAEGDRVLRTVGRVLRQHVRRVDTVARLGGDEFALVFPETDEAGAHQIVSKLREELHHAFQADGMDVTCSIGVVTFMNPAISVPEAVAAADGLMYEVKRQGKGGIKFSQRSEAARPGADAHAQGRTRPADLA